jgi:archaellum component FlaG (FlaF/FlaG flagellin family)
MKNTIIITVIIFFISNQSRAQNEILTKVDGGASWLTGSGGIYSGDGETPTDVDVTVGDNIDFDAGTLFIDGTNDNVGIGTDDPQSVLHIKTSGTALSDYNPLTIEYNGTPTDLLSPTLEFKRSRYASSANSIVALADEIGAIKFMGYDGANYINGASIRARIDNDPSIGTDMPTRLEFLTTPDNDATPQIRMTIKETGNVGINFETPNSTLHVEGSFSTAIRIAPTSNPPVNPSGPATPADVTIGKNDHTVVFNPSTVGYNSVTLPNASSCGGRIYYLLNRSGFTI